MQRVNKSGKQQLIHMNIHLILLQESWYEGAFALLSADEVI